MKKEIILSVIRKKNHELYEAKRISLGEQPIHDFNGYEYISVSKYKELLSRTAGVRKSDLYRLVVGGKVVNRPTYAHPDKAFIQRSHNYDADGNFVPSDKRRPNQEYFKNDTVFFRGKEWKVKTADFIGPFPFITLEADGKRIDFPVEEFEDELNIRLTGVRNEYRPKWRQA